MRKLMILSLALIVNIFIMTSVSYATTYVVYGTKLYTYAQSTDESQANLVRSSNGIYQDGDHPWCGRRMYVEFADVDLFQRAMASELADQTVNIMYEDASENRFIKGHVEFRCKLLSVWR